MGKSTLTGIVQPSAHLGYSVLQLVIFFLVKRMMLPVPQHCLNCLDSRRMQQMQFYQIVYSILTRVYHLCNECIHHILYTLLWKHWTVLLPTLVPNVICVGNNQWYTYFVDKFGSTSRAAKAYNCAASSTVVLAAPE